VIFSPETIEAYAPVFVEVKYHGVFISTIRNARIDVLFMRMARALPSYHKKLSNELQVGHWRDLTYTSRKQ
jgi:hypothetical protein